MFRITDKVKYTLTAKLAIGDKTQSIITWINSNPVLLQRHLIKTPSIKLNPHGEVTLKKKLNEDTGSNTKRSPRGSTK